MLLLRPVPSVRRAISLLALVLALACPAHAQSMVEGLLASYDAVTTVVCQVRKETTSPAGSVRTLSRVYYAKPDRLHVENVSPVKRRIVCDGRTFYSFIEGDPKGFSRAVADLDQEMLFQLRKVPGTGMDHLFRLRGMQEQRLEPTEDFPERVLFHEGRQWIVLSLDSEGRLALIEFFDDAERSHKTAEYRFDQFKEVAPGIWIPLLHQAWLDTGGVVTRETTRLDHIEINTPIAENLFVPGLYFKNVEFVDSFQKIYK